jgi:hypothetical protein
LQTEENSKHKPTHKHRTIIQTDIKNYPGGGQEESCDSMELEPTYTGILEQLILGRKENKK